MYKYSTLHGCNNNIIIIRVLSTRTGQCYIQYSRVHITYRMDAYKCRVEYLDGSLVA